MQRTIEHYGRRTAIAYQMDEESEIFSLILDKDRKTEQITPRVFASEDASSYFQIGWPSQWQEQESPDVYGCWLTDPDSKDELFLSIRISDRDHASIHLSDIDRLRGILYMPKTLWQQIKTDLVAIERTSLQTFLVRTNLVTDLFAGVHDQHASQPLEQTLFAPRNT